jgi:hypothetical protein
MIVDAGLHRIKRAGGTAQTPITRMKLRVEMADQPELRDKLLQDLDNMTRLAPGGSYCRDPAAVCRAVPADRPSPPAASSG